MIQGDFTHCTTLEQFYKEITALHKKAHGEKYTAHHDEMFNVLKYCTSYRELGIMQGATAACAVMAGIKNLHLIDITLKSFIPYVHLFTDLDLRVDECDDLKVPNLTPVDFLLVDSLHNYNHVTKQLAVHSDFVNKYILFHDSAAQEGVRRAINDFLASNSNWKLIKHYSENVGYSLIKRIS